MKNVVRFKSGYIPVIGNFRSLSRTLMVVLIFFLVSFCRSGVISAQDVIVLKTGEEIQATVSEVSIDVIKYKKFDNPSGPVYTIEKSKVFMIKYQNGSKDVFGEQQVTKPEAAANIAKAQAVASSLQTLTYRRGSVSLAGKYLPAKEIRKIMTPYPNALSAFNSGKTLTLIGDITAYVGDIAILVALLRGVNLPWGSDARNAVYMEGIIEAVPCLVASIVLTSIGRGKIKSSVNLYNTSLNKPVTYRLDFGIQRNGVGFALKF